MKRSFYFACAAAMSSTAIAADMLPLKKGIYVPVSVACREASNAEIVNYWGGKSAIGVAQATCTIKKLTRKGTAFTLYDECKDLQSGEIIEGGPTVLNISSPSNFRMNGTAYRYCGPKVQF
ncbi:hypothetical protein G7077_02925 [Sphingomonas piscis]|uniref:Uncharacterized protein n=1 Tax=Sphingomonas piscis TaxID=2714943 RepID=A0A6G7YMQ4_9SPHN|nr:hypothetical protein [Sphingomonas piscis]QIK78018.1 hypothetical protein G7077_02925 [Sphingomonas piscis]